ncbi:hypothetical protein AGMMS49959_17030 [Planctomycetales bacterium]|nr:hypothetical protein AGMMS49959_17030 [Planctomycetales bacterium]
MHPFAFQSQVLDNRIEIPTPYRVTSATPVLVTVSFLSDYSTEPPPVVPRRATGRVTKGNFKALQIDTQNFVFNREDANARR